MENLAETDSVEIFGRTKQILSVQCVRTLTMGNVFHVLLNPFPQGKKTRSLLIKNIQDESKIKK